MDALALDAASAASSDTWRGLVVHSDDDLVLDGASSVALVGDEVTIQASGHAVDMHGSMISMATQWNRDVSVSLNGGTLSMEALVADGASLHGSVGMWSGGSNTTHASAHAGVPLRLRSDAG